MLCSLWCRQWRKVLRYFQSRNGDQCLFKHPCFRSSIKMLRLQWFSQCPYSIRVYHKPRRQRQSQSLNDGDNYLWDSTERSSPTLILKSARIIELAYAEPWWWGWWTCVPLHVLGSAVIKHEFPVYLSSGQNKSLLLSLLPRRWSFYGLDLWDNLIDTVYSIVQSEGCFLAHQASAL